MARGGLADCHPVVTTFTSMPGFSAASSVGKCPLALTARRSLQVRASIQGLDGVGGADHFPDILGKGLERRDLRPGATPALANSRVTLAPGTGLEFGECHLCSISAGRAVNLLERRCQAFAVLPGYEVHGIAE